MNIWTWNRFLDLYRADTFWNNDPEWASLFILDTVQILCFCLCSAGPYNVCITNGKVVKLQQTFFWWYKTLINNPSFYSRLILSDFINVHFHPKRHLKILVYWLVLEKCCWFWNLVAKVGCFLHPFAFGKERYSKILRLILETCKIIKYYIFLSDAIW